MGEPRRIDGLALAGVLLSSVGAGALTLEIAARGLRGFVTSRVDFAVVLGLLVLATGISWWAFDRADGWWRFLAATGLAISAFALLITAVLVLVRVAIDFSEIFSNRSRTRRHQTQRRRRSRRAGW